MITDANINNFGYWVRVIMNTHTHAFPLQPLLNGSPEAQCEPSVLPPQYDTLVRHNPRHQVKHNISILCIIIILLATSKAQFIIRRYTMHCIASLVETQHNARIDLDTILVFLCVAFLRQIVKNQ